MEDSEILTLGMQETKISMLEIYNQMCQRLKNSFNYYSEIFGKSENENEYIGFEEAIKTLGYDVDGANENIFGLLADDINIEGSNENEQINFYEIIVGDKEEKINFEEIIEGEKEKLTFDILVTNFPDESKDYSELNHEDVPSEEVRVENSNNNNINEGTYEQELAEKLYIL